MSEGRRGGERRQHARPSACTRRRHERSSQALRDASFARSFDPCTLILTMLRGRKPTEVGRSIRHHGWANSGNREETNTGAGTSERSAARRVSPLPQGRGRGTSKKRKEIEVSVPARIEEFGFGCSHVVMQLQKSVGDVWPRISSANALQKERSGSSERGPSSERRSAGETVGGRVGRRVQSRVGLTAKDGRGPAQDPGCREIVIQRLSHRQKRCGGRGTGAVRATGSYEGSLPIEGISDHHEASAFTRRRQRWSWRSRHSSDPDETFQKKDVRPDCSTREGA